MWGEEQRKAFDRIKEYLLAPLVPRAPKVGVGFRLYIAAQPNVIGVMLTQDNEGRGVIAYLSQRLLDTEPDILSLKSFA
jgi:hypothetical protein